jgi:hypothetical protein
LGTSSAEERIAEQPRPKAPEPVKLAAVEPAKPAAQQPRAKKLAPRVTPQSKAIAKDIESITEKLCDSARDIVEQLEEALPDELETRFLQGERDIYVQTLHDRRGKKNTKQLSNRYGNDRGLRTRVDSYIRLFERLLDTVSQTQNSNQMIEACLGSESGKVYMLLAEASGRITPN